MVSLPWKAAGHAETCPYDTMSYVRKDDVKAVLGRVLTWPKPAQEKAVASLRAIEPRMGVRQRIPRDADCSEVATDKEVEAAFRFFGAA